MGLERSFYQKVYLTRVKLFTFLSHGSLFISTQTLNPHLLLMNLANLFLAVCNIRLLAYLAAKKTENMIYDDTLIRGDK